MPDNKTMLDQLVDQTKKVVQKSKQILRAEKAIAEREQERHIQSSARRSGATDPSG